jgi:hypothetical protein
MAKTKRNEMTFEEAKNLFYYKDGYLYKLKNNKKVSSIGSRNYISVMINYKNYLAHRIIYLLHHGYMPMLVDHIDGDKLNNKIENLREATYSQNSFNRVKKDSLLNIKNVTFCKLKKKFKAQLSINGKNKHLGYFDLLNDAAIAAEKARNNICKEFARHE